MTPVICMITDRRRGDGAGDMVWRVAAAGRAGVHRVQIRERDLDGRLLLEVVGACVDAVRQTPTRIVVNERADVARAAGAHGVHLRGDSMPASRLRALAGPRFLIGRSIHSVDEARRATRDGAVDYLRFGPVLPTASTPGAAPAGPATLEAVVRSTTVPVLAVGGVTAETVPAIARAGAAGAGAIGLFAGRDSDRDVRDTVRALQRAFDSASRGS